MQQTFAMIKSHAFAQHPQIRQRIMDSGLSIIKWKPGTLPPGAAEAIYAEHEGRPYHSALLESVAQPVVAMVLVGEDAVARWRALMGPTDPIKAPPGTIRGDFGNKAASMAENVVHGSDSPESACREIMIVFAGVGSTFDIEAYDAKMKAALGGIAISPKRSRP